MIETREHEQLTDVERHEPLRELLEFDVSQEILERLELDQLPSGIGVIGGAARAVALEQFFGERAPVRDIDLVAIQGRVDQDVDLGKLASVYMPDDAAYGHGVKEQELSTYFDTRDFTINEVLIVDGKIYLTQRCYENLRDKQIVWTEFEAGEGDDREVGQKMYLKALLMVAVMRVSFGKGELVDDASLWPGGSEFFHALMLNKAMQYGRSTMTEYVNQTYEEPMDDEALIADAARLAVECQFEFRGSMMARRVMRIVNGEGPDYGDVYDPEIRHAIDLLLEFRGNLPSGAVVEEYVSS